MEETKHYATKINFFKFTEMRIDKSIRFFYAELNAVLSFFFFYHLTFLSKLKKVTKQ